MNDSVIDFKAVGHRFKRNAILKYATGTKLNSGK